MPAPHDYAAATSMSIGQTRFPVNQTIVYASPAAIVLAVSSGLYPSASLATRISQLATTLPRLHQVMFALLTRVPVSKVNINVVNSPGCNAPATDNTTSTEPSMYFKYYHYEPSLAAAVVFTALFGLLTLWHAVLIFKNKTWYSTPVIVGDAFETAGYIARAISHSQGANPTLAPYVVQTLLLLVAPPLFAATIYMLLGHIMIGVGGESYSVIMKRWLTKTFVTSDVICFLVQLGGAGLMASSTSSTASTGSHIVLAGLLLQIVIFGFFVVVAAVFHRRMLAAPQTPNIDTAMSWQRQMVVLYVTSGFILVRNIVRVADFVEGFDGYIILHEVLYVFDALLMAAVMAAYCVCYPAAFFGHAAKTVKAESVEMGSGIGCAAP